MRHLFKVTDIPLRMIKKRRNVDRFEMSDLEGYTLDSFKYIEPDHWSMVHMCQEAEISRESTIYGHMKSTPYKWEYRPKKRRKYSGGSLLPSTIIEHPLVFFPLAESTRIEAEPKTPELHTIFPRHISHTGHELYDIREEQYNKFMRGEISKLNSQLINSKYNLTINRSSTRKRCSRDMHEDRSSKRRSRGKNKKVLISMI
ncbi:hypothetical protein ACOME3_008482 [Neoechinorhynchus agilis]